MNRYRIYAPRKCGSSVIRRMTADITSVKILPDRIFPISTDIGNAELHFSRDFNFNKQIPKEEHLIFIPRNPISMCISAYYSFGYTHKQPVGMSEDEFLNFRNRIRKQGLETFIEKVVGKQSELIKSILDYNHNNQTIIPYELMVSNFSDFLKQYLDALNMSNLYQTVYSKWNENFKPIRDKSDLIVSGEYKAHKRTTDINEWRKKLESNLIRDILERYPVIGDYLELLSTYNIISS